MYHPMLIFERHTGCLLSARLRPGTASSHARIVPMLLQLVPRLQAAFPGVQIKLRSMPAWPCLSSTSSAALCDSICIGHPRQLRVPASGRTLAEKAQAPLSPQPASPAQLFQLPPPRPHLAASAPHLLQSRTHRHRNQPALRDYQPCRPRRGSVCVLQRPRRVREPHREFKNGFRADRLSCHRFLANAFRLLLHSLAYNLVNLFRLHLPQPWRSAQSKPCAPVCSKSATAYALPLAASASIWPLDGPSRNCFPPLHSPSTAAKSQLHPKIFFSLSGRCGAVPKIIQVLLVRLVSQERILKLTYISSSQTGSCLARTKISSLVNNAG